MGEVLSGKPASLNHPNPLRWLAACIQIAPNSVTGVLLDFKREMLDLATMFASSDLAALGSTRYCQ